MRRAILLLFLCVTTAIASPAQTFTTLYRFQQYSDGEDPYGSLLEGVNGQYYGETIEGGTRDGGTVFSVTSKGVLTTVYAFDLNNPNEPNEPSGGLALGNDGAFYGTAGGGITHSGTVFKVTPGGVMTTLYTFCSLQNCADGGYPTSGLTLGVDGNFYGTTEAGVSDNCYAGCGTVFRITPTGGLTVLHGFHDADGAGYKSRLLRVSDGSFYGTTASGGTSGCVGSDNDGCGTVYRITPEGAFSTIYTFCQTNYCSDGGSPKGGLIQGSDGYFYGTTTYDAVNGCGTIFRLTSRGQLTTIHTFDGTHGCQPMGELLQGPDGNFYGTTFYGGTAGYGTVFQTTPTGALTVLHNFCTHQPCDDDSWPTSGLTLGSDGLLYGVTSDLGINGIGTVFTVDLGFKPLSVSKTGSGTVIGGDGHIYCGSACSSVYTSGEQLELTAIPAPGYTFNGWTGCDNMQGTYCFVNVNAARNVSAAFSSSSVTLTSLVLKPSTVKGGQLSAATLTLSGPAPAGGLGVSIASNVPNAAHPPAWIVVPGGKTTASFAVRTFPVKSNTTANISASTGGSQVSATLTVTNGYGSQRSSGQRPEVEASGFGPGK